MASQLLYANGHRELIIQGSWRSLDVSVRVCVRVHKYLDVTWYRNVSRTIQWNTETIRVSYKWDKKIFRENDTRLRYFIYLIVTNEQRAVTSKFIFLRDALFYVPID